MKTIVLCLDGFEYEFVDRMDLNAIKQRIYRKIEVPISAKYGVPNSPQVWASFLTGHVVDINFKRTKPPLKRALDAVAYLEKKFKVKLGLGRILDKAPTKMKMEYASFPKLKEHTFLDELAETTNNIFFLYNFPYYDFDGLSQRVTASLSSGRVSLEKHIQLLEKVFDHYTIDFLSKLTANVMRYFEPQLTLAYLPFPDLMQHLCANRPELIFKHYDQVQRLVRAVQGWYRDARMMIVSDHGFNLATGLHSDYGFYSCNMQVEPEPEKITDFAKLLLQGEKK